MSGKRTTSGSSAPTSSHQPVRGDISAAVSALAHDLRSPLTALKLNAEVLRSRAREFDPADSAGLTAGLTRMRDIAKRIELLLDDHVDQVRNEPATMESRTDRTDMVSLVQQCVDEAQWAWSSHVFTVSAECSSLSGQWSRSGLSRVVANLLDNAAKYSAPESSIAVSIAQESLAAGPFAVVSVSDQGIGIPEEELDDIFNRFYRGRNVRDSLSGHGIGLSNVRQILEEHDGTISVRSALGRGTTFSVRLPLSIAVNPSRQADQPGTEPRARSPQYDTTDRGRRSSGPKRVA
jgi:signal transduction histidine kinase